MLKYDAKLAEVGARKLKAAPVKGESAEPTRKTKAMAAAAAKNAQALGFSFSAELANELASRNEADLKDAWGDISSALKALVGDGVKYEPFYPNFPAQVIDADEAELYFAALAHYATMGALRPDYPKEERFPLIGGDDRETLGLATEEDFLSLAASMLSSKVPLSAKDLEDLDVLMDAVDWKTCAPDDVPMKETAAHVAAKAFGDGDFEGAAKYLKTATDVARTLADASGGSGAPFGRKTKFRKLSRPERRFVMDALAKAPSLEEDMWRDPLVWIKIGEIVHPGEYGGKKGYGEVAKAFASVRSGKAPERFSTLTEKAVADGDWKKAVRLLSKRPGEFARRLAQLSRIEGADADAIALAFLGAAKKPGAVSTRVLWQAKAAFDAAGEPRFAFPKAADSKCREIGAPKRATDPETAAKFSAVLERAILAQYAAREPMGAVWVDPAMRKIAAPFTNRSSSVGLRQLPRGSRVAMTDGTSVARLFIWWTNLEGGETDGNETEEWEADERLRVDLDLTATILDENWKAMATVSWRNVREPGLGVVHSGDVVDGGPHGGDGACEFVDVDVEKAAAAGARYVVAQVYSFTGTPFRTLPCAFGWMERKDADSGEVFEPSTVKNRIALTSNSVAATTAAFDLETREIVWCDLSVGAAVGRPVAAEENARGATAAAMACVKWTKPSVYDVAVANAKARGTLVYDKNDADLVFSDNPKAAWRTEPIYDRDGICVGHKGTEREAGEVVRSEDVTKLMELI